MKGFIMRILTIIFITGIFLYFSIPLPMWLDIVFLSICSFELFIAFLGFDASIDIITPINTTHFSTSKKTLYVIFTFSLAFFNLTTFNPFAQSITYAMFIMSVL